MPRPRMFPALIVEWGNPHQLGAFALVEDPSLGQGGLSGGRQYRSHPWRGLEPCISLPPGWAGANAGGDLCIRLIDEALEVVNMARKAVLDGRVGQRHPMALSDQHFQELAPALHQRVQLLGRLVWHGAG